MLVEADHLIHVVNKLGIDVDKSRDRVEPCVLVLAQIGTCRFAHERHGLYKAFGVRVHVSVSGLQYFRDFFLDTS